MKSGPVLFGALAVGALALIAKRGAAVPLGAGQAAGQSTGNGLMRQATANGRSYTVFAMGGGTGEYQIVSNANPRVWLLISQTGEDDKDDGGTPAALDQLRADMKSFPSTMFTT